MTTYNPRSLSPPMLLDPAEGLPSLDELHRESRYENLLVNRKDHGYEVYQLAQRYICKRYHFPLSRQLDPGEREWEHEQRILDALAKHPLVPRSYGIKTEQRNGEQVYYSLREYIPGESLKQGFTPIQAGLAGRLVASLHQSLVVTRDPQGKNFLFTDTGLVSFIDYGKASLYQRRSPAFYYAVAKELFMIWEQALAHRSRLWARFHRYYFETMDYSAYERRLLKSLIGFFAWRRAYHDFRRGCQLLKARP